VVLVLAASWTSERVLATGVILAALVIVSVMFNLGGNVDVVAD